VKPSRRRPVVMYLVGAYRVSERHACGLMVLPRATHRYQSIRDPLTELRLRMRQLAQTRIRYRYRKIRVLLIREGWKVGKKLAYRLYREEGLGLRMRPKARRRLEKWIRRSQVPSPTLELFFCERMRQMRLSVRMRRPSHTCRSSIGH